MSDRKTLKLKFHGKILDHLGIQMYQSPVAAVAELISNAWDADAERVDIELPSSINDSAVVKIKDNGIGMTLNECETRYLNVGYCRRGNDNSAIKSPKGRPVLGRKGIGKFAGFGISKIIEVKTISKVTGELTRFLLNLDVLKEGSYVADGGDIDVIEYCEPDAIRAEQHGTEILLKSLVLKRNIRSDFPNSMARRFLLLKDAHDFCVKINGNDLPKDGNLPGIEFSFPTDYLVNEIPEGVTRDQDGWAEESIEGHFIKWKINFYKEPIGVEELRGVSVFANGKLAQKAFLFNLAGGLSGQHGQEYLSGQVIADYIDQMEFDIISPERQRINWEDENAIPLEERGQKRVKELLNLWKVRRGERRQQLIEDKVDGFSDRLELLPKHDSKIVRNTLKKLGSISTLSDDHFKNLGLSVLQAWEQGRLHDLIADLSSVENFNEAELISLLTEQDVLTALNIAEAVKTKQKMISGLRARIKERQLENAVRDYLSTNPWLIDPEYQTYKKETSLKNILDDIAIKRDIPEAKEGKRIDLVLASGDSLIVLEFMRPGLALDVDHLMRYELYFRSIKTHLIANTGLGFTRVFGMVVADNLAKDALFVDKLAAMQKENMQALDWNGLLARSERRWSDLFSAIVARSPKDHRIDGLIEAPIVV